MEDKELLLERENKIYEFMSSEKYVPLKRAELCIMLDVPQTDRLVFDDLINRLVTEGKVIETKKGKLMPSAKLNIFPGTFVGNQKGFGFVNINREGERDIFVPAEFTNGAMHNDKVLVKVTRGTTGDKRAEGEIIKVIEFGFTEIVGTFEAVKGFGFVTPDEKKIAQDVFVPHDMTKGAVTGHKVVVKITRRPEGRRNPEGRVLEILGHINDPGVDILSIIKQFALPEDFPEDVYTQIDTIDSETINPKDLDGREDLRNVVMVTIDGEDAKDLDDAVSLETLENGNYRLGVHIADVSNYVTEGSPLDKEAFERGTSIYLVDRVIPMLPHKLSNGICSLNPQMDRLALSCIMDIDSNGRVVSHRLVKSVICTNRRMTYTAVKEILEDENPETIAEYSDLVDMFKLMERLRNTLLKKREKRGSVNFDLPEAKIILDENGKPIDIKPYDRNVATSIIEEFMLICNETVAEDYFWQEVPFVFRNHETPSDEKIEKLQEFIKNFGYRIKGKGELHPKDIAQLLDVVAGKPDEHIISRVVLRSMKQAKYMAENLGHFGLAAQYYCHFTSPIRRYPDLQIHRIIKENMSGGISDRRQKYYTKNLPDIAGHCSVRERLAEEAERETDKLKQVQFMQDKIGQVFGGIVSGIMNWGIFVELPNTIEGMISVTSMDDDFYVFDESNMRFIGQHTKKVYRLGDSVFVQVAKVSVEMRTIDFVFTDAPEEIEE